jgi:hypothetical protein
MAPVGARLCKKTTTNRLPDDLVADDLVADDLVADDLIVMAQDASPRARVASPTRQLYKIIMAPILHGRTTCVGTSCFYNFPHNSRQNHVPFKPIANLCPRKELVPHTTKLLQSQVFSYFSPCFRPVFGV